MLWYKSNCVESAYITYSITVPNLSCFQITELVKSPSIAIPIYFTTCIVLSV